MSTGMEEEVNAEDIGPSEVNTTKTSHLVKVHKDKLTVTYNGKANHNHDVGAVQANRSFSHSVLIGYFEMTVLNQGERACMAIGLAKSSFNNMRHPGWEPGSYGYHADDGRKFHNSSRGEAYSVKYGTVGDVVGCGINFATREIFFTKNAKHLGTAFTDPTHSYYPTVGLHSSGEQVRLNFGADPFVFNLEEMLREEREKMQAALSAVPISMMDVNELVRQYLRHEGYCDALEAFEASAALPCGGKGQEDSDERNRSAVRRLIIEGQAAAARQLCLVSYPNLFEKCPLARAELACQEFVELVATNKKTEAMLFARSELGVLLKSSADAIPAGDARAATAGANGSNGTGCWSMGSGGERMEEQEALDREDQEGACMHDPHLCHLRQNGGDLSDLMQPLSDEESAELCMESECEDEEEDIVVEEHKKVCSLVESVLGLLAYSDPHESPLAHLLQRSHRMLVADVVNAVILESQGHAKVSNLEFLLQHLIASHDSLRQLQGGRGEKLDIMAPLMSPRSSKNLGSSSKGVV